MIRPLSLVQVATATEGTLFGVDADFSQVNTDTRSIEAGDVFVALRGDSFDGHDFLAQAQTAGAQALVVDSMLSEINCSAIQVADTTIALGQIGALNRKNFTGKLVALTGSNGKTTVKEMLSCILSGVGKVTKTQGNLNNHIGAPKTLLDINADSDYAVIEMGASGAGEIDYLAALAVPDVALVNNVGSAHLSGFGSIDGVAAEKSKIYKHIVQNGTAVVNLDDAYAPVWLKWLAAERADINVLTFALSNELADVRAQSIKLNDVGGYDFSILAKAFGSEQISLQLLGRQNINNALAAAACALALSIDIKVVQKGLNTVAQVVGRMQTVVVNEKLQLVNDSYNANPTSVKAAAEYLSDCSQVGVKTMLVLGALAELGSDANAMLSELATDLASKKLTNLVTVGDANKVINDIFLRQSASALNNHFASREAAADYICDTISSSKEKIIVLVKGSRSSKMDEVVNMIITREGI